MSSSRPTSPSAEPPAKRARTRSPSQADGNYDGEAELVRIKKRLIKVKQLRERGTSFGADEEQQGAGSRAADGRSPDGAQPFNNVKPIEEQLTPMPKSKSPSPEFRILGSSSRIGAAVEEPVAAVSNQPSSATTSATTSSQPPPRQPIFLPAAVPRSTLAPRRAQHPPLASCRSVYSNTLLNHIEEGTYGIVFRARCNETGGIYALKKLKLEEEKQGFPITSLREVMALMVAGEHENVVGVREIVVGDTLNQ
jgi:cell division cycle 2-like protein